MVGITVDTQKLECQLLSTGQLRSWTLTLVLSISRMNRSLFSVWIMWIAKHYFNVDVNVSFNIKSFNDSLIPVLLQCIFCMRDSIISKFILHRKLNETIIPSWQSYPVTQICFLPGAQSLELTLPNSNASLQGTYSYCSLFHCLIVHFVVSLFIATPSYGAIQKCRHLLDTFDIISFDETHLIEYTQMKNNQD